MVLSSSYAIEYSVLNTIISPPSCCYLHLVCRRVACADHFCSIFIIRTYLLTYPMARASSTLMSSLLLYLASPWTKLDRAAIWTENNHLLFNYSKYNIMLIPVSRRPATDHQPTLSNLTLNSRLLSAVNQLTIFGVDIRSDLCWARQAQRTCGNLNGRLAALRRLDSSLNTNTRHQLVNVFVKPHVLLCLPVWGNTSLTCQAAT